MLPFHQQDSRPCTASRSEENGSSAGGVPTKTPLRENGNRSSPGSRPILNGAAVIFSGNCSAAPQDAINPCKSAHSNEACGRYGRISSNLLRSNGKPK